ncbi:MAG: hypothetical protein LIV24_01810 [Eubacterium sp.]|nr:hypothetical protein [Eubacterium sp.]
MDKETLKAFADAIQAKTQNTKMKKGSLLRIIAVAVAATAAICGLAYAVYRYFTPDYLEDFDDEDFDDDFDSYFDENDKDEEEKPHDAQDASEESGKKAE